uniref:Caspase family p20 domain-containing protein n=1 Tax=Panagrolaimus sp. ES5 TaxID=591445 RepID=A0AC34G113_9BILA
MSDGVALSTNLSELPYGLFHSLSLSLESGSLWRLICNDSDDTVFCLSQNDIERFQKLNDPGAQYLRYLGNRGLTVEKLLKRLHTLAKCHGPIMDRPQLLLHRKFCPIIWSRKEQIRVSIVADGTQLKLEYCQQCNLNDLDRIYNKLVNGINNDGRDPANAAASSAAAAPGGADDEMLDTMDCTTAVTASDKVALIISNRTYHPNMSNLITPHCDAETLAEILQSLKFKTVTLGDLKLEEMRFIIKEYRKLLGEGVYAVFYFVGHGFEANGQCYLLPTDAPGHTYGPQHCISMDWVLSIFSDYSPALNLILLDICRKFLPSDLDLFTQYAEQYRKNAKVNRNTVYGYATSGGVGAYEIKGETNGVFMKYFKNRILNQQPILDILNRVFRDIEKDKKVRDVQIPELRSNLTKPRSLYDPFVVDGHTNSFENHTIHWRLMHELPNPVKLKFIEEKVTVTIWFDFCGHFTNKAYAFSSVGDIRTAEDEDNCDDNPPSEHAQSFQAYLKFPPALDVSNPKTYCDDEEGESLC